MSRYYKTSRSAPIVDYTPEYPFEELFKATKYRNELQDTRMGEINSAYDDVLGLNFIPGSTDENGVYQPSPSEQYIKQKRSEAEELMNKYNNVDLTKSAWGNISRDITKLTNDPTLADIQTSYNNYSKQIAHQRELDKQGRLPANPWGQAGDPTQQGGWDVNTQGVYPFMPVGGYDDPSTLLERYYKDMNVDERIDPGTGLIVKDVTEEDISRVAMGMDETFMNTPAGKDAIANYRLNNNGATNLTDEDISRQIVYDYGQKYLGRDISGGTSNRNNINNKNKNNTIGLDELDRAFLPGTNWAVSNNTTTSSEIMDKIATPIGDGLYTLESGTNVYLNPVATKRDGSTNDIINAHNISVTKNFLDLHGDKMDYLKHHYGEWKDGKFVGWRDMNIDAQRKKYYDDDWLTSSDRSKLKQQKKDHDYFMNEFDNNNDGKVTKADFPDIKWQDDGPDNNSPYANFDAWYYKNVGRFDPVAMKESMQKMNKLKWEKGAQGYAIRQDLIKRDNLQLELDNIVADYATEFNVDVMNPELQELVKNYQPGNKKDMADLDLSKEEMQQMMSLELSELAGSGGVWMHINNAPTKNMITGRQDGMPVTSKFIQGNMLFTEAQLNEYFQRKGYDEASDWFGDWDDEFVGANSRYNVFSMYTPSPASDLYIDKNTDGEADVTYYQLNGAWRQVNDDWTTANNINESFYGTGKAGNQERLLQEELYQQERNANKNEAIFGQALMQNQMRNFINSKRLYSNNMPAGTISNRLNIANNINNFIETEIGSGDAERIDAANRLETYLTDNNLWEDGYINSSTFGTGKFKNQRIYDTDEVPEGTMPWDYKENEAALLGGQFVDLFKSPIKTEDQRNLIYDHIAPWGGGGSYGGVTYIKDGNFLTNTASVNAYKKASESRAEGMGLNKIEGSMFSDLDFSDEVYAPYVTNVTKAVLGNINLISNAIDERLVVTGLYRTPEYNKAIGGADNSTHTKGMGIDIRLNDKFDQWLNTSTQAQKQNNNTYIVYHQTTGQPMFTVLKEDDHFHIESFK